MKFGFIAKHRSIWPVAWLCEALGVWRSGFHAWLHRGPSAGKSRARKAIKRTKLQRLTVTWPALPIDTSLPASAAPGDSGARSRPMFA